MNTHISHQSEEVAGPAQTAQSRRETAAPTPHESAGAAALQRHLDIVNNSSQALQLKAQAGLAGGGNPAFTTQPARTPHPHGKMASPVVQREIDTSSSPFLPAYGADETPAWQDDEGVPTWAADAYREAAPITLIASVADGKIGSVYDDDGRIRMTHGGGPKRSDTGADSRRLQFNIDYRGATAEFKLSHPRHRPSGKTFKKWLAAYLVGRSVESMPAWATLVTSPDTALDLYEKDAPPDTSLLEIFVDINGKVEKWHPSRGAAARFDTDKQVQSVLHAALAHLEAQGIVEPDARNVAFYKFIQSRLPEFVKNIRSPAEV